MWVQSVIFALIFAYLPVFSVLLGSVLLNSETLPLCALLRAHIVQLATAEPETLGGTNN